MGQVQRCVKYRCVHDHNVYDMWRCIVCKMLQVWSQRMLWSLASFAQSSRHLSSVYRSLSASLLLTHSSSSQLHTSVYPSLTEARFFHHSIPPLPSLLKPIASPVSSQLSCFHVQYTQVKVLGFHMCLTATCKVMNIYGMATYVASSTQQLCNKLV